MNLGTYRSALFGPQNTKKSLPKYSIGDRAILDKKVHSNPKFSQVPSRTDTGYNLRKKQQLQEEIQKYYKVTKDEVFSRISLLQLLRLMLAQPAPAAPEHIQQTDTVAEQPDMVQTAETTTAAPAYLLVDVREATAYSTSHLITAINHPSCRLGRSINWECRELLQYRNHPDHIIIVYDYAEDLAPEYAATLVHRGYVNVFLLSGGLRLAQDKFSYPLVVTKAEARARAAEMPTSHMDTSMVEGETSRMNLIASGKDMNKDDEVEGTSSICLFNLRNERLPEDVITNLAAQLATVYVPPLTLGEGSSSWGSAPSTSRTAGGRRPNVPSLRPAGRGLSKSRV
ncbi:centrosomal protein of 41 kDa isoform X2 [Hyalella azteca]|uniref:Centrosomal protein of 41 kDa isoform X2 n=1 Tax=Hyalella azteca TaxID=294128 RepID=A0A979FP36_HYAAZ|nr:centrosomal protein of 41 kDa isoform X2 [Hyalella azteca]